ncbi:MAG: helix-turn-helix domain-containing protein [Anaerolineales bacterium]|nr:helix-turn-helix domain-containing protein [Anaerolineales bacterium]
MKTQANSSSTLPIEEAALLALAQKMGAQISHVVYASLVEFLILLREEIKQSGREAAAHSTIPATSVPEYDAPEPVRYKPFLTAGDIAKMLGISKAKAYRLIQKKEIRSISIDKTVRVRWEDWEAFVQKHLVG